MSWYLVLFIDSEHPSHERLWQVVDELLPGGSTIKSQTRRYYCTVWKDLTEEEPKPFFFRLLDGDLKACKRYILALDAEDAAEAVERCMKSVERRRVDAEAMWVELKNKQFREISFE